MADPVVSVPDPIGTIPKPTENGKMDFILDLGTRLYVNNVSFFADRHIDPVDAAEQSIDAAHAFWHVWKQKRIPIQLHNC